MTKGKRFLIGGAVILAALGYIIYGGMQQALVYFKMPSELRAEEKSMQGKFVRMGGMVLKGSMEKDLQQLTYKFQLTDGSANFPVYFKGVPPDMFAEGKGAVVEGRVGDDGVFQASLIMAKHAEDYNPIASGMSPNKSFVPAKEAGAK